MTGSSGDGQKCRSESAVGTQAGDVVERNVELGVRCIEAVWDEGELVRRDVDVATEGDLSVQPGQCLQRLVGQ